MPFRTVIGGVLLTTAALAHAQYECSTANSDVRAVAEFEKCRLATESGDADAQFGYGLILWGGNNRPAKPREGLDWLRRAARQGHLLSRVALGKFLSSDEVASDLRNLPEAYAWWVVGGETDAAAELRIVLSPQQFADAEAMATKFKAAYGPSR